MTYNEKLKAIFKKHGYNKQLNKLSEEVSEFVREVSRYEYGHLMMYDDVIDNFNKGQMEAEFADVLVLLCQFRLIYDLDVDKIKEVMKAKIDRQCERDNINA